MRSQFAAHTDLFPPGLRPSSFSNPFEADFIICRSCNNVTLRLMYASATVLTREEVDFLLSSGFNCVTEAEIFGDPKLPLGTRLSFLGEADLKRLQRLLEEARHKARGRDEMSRSDEIAKAMNGPLSEMFHRKRTEDAHRNAEEILKNYFGQYWSLLHPGTQALLIEAEQLREAFIVSSLHGVGRDFAPAVIQYSRALESEVHSTIFVPFREYARGALVANNSTIKSALRNFDKLNEFCKKRDGNLTLGEQSYILKDIVCETSATNLFVKFLEGIGIGRTVICGEDGIAHRVLEFTKEFRNRAAHKGGISKEQCTGARAYLIQEPIELLKTLLRCTAQKLGNEPI